MHHITNVRTNISGIKLHDPVFAGYMVRWSLNQKDILPYALGYLNATVLASCIYLSSYASHMIADLVGFSADGGYLSSGIQGKFGGI